MSNKTHHRSPRDPNKRYIFTPSNGGWILKAICYGGGKKHSGRTTFIPIAPKWAIDGMAILDLAKENGASHISGFGHANGIGYVFYEQINQDGLGDSQVKSS